jgi:hypothetical protein
LEDSGFDGLNDGDSSIHLESREVAAGILGFDMDKFISPAVVRGVGERVIMPVMEAIRRAVSEGTGRELREDQVISLVARTYNAENGKMPRFIYGFEFPLSTILTDFDRRPLPTEGATVTIVEGEAEIEILSERWKSSGSAFMVRSGKFPLVLTYEGKHPEGESFTRIIAFNN